MRLLKSSLFTIALLCLTISPLLAASMEELRKGVGEQGGFLKTNVDPSQAERLRLPSGADIPATDLKKFLERSVQDNDLSVHDRLPTTKAKIKLKLEAGDGSALATWTTSGVDNFAGQLRYFVTYGTEAERLDKRLDVGAVTSYKLRELKNNQIYHVQIQGYTKDKSLVFFSEDEQVIPLSDDQQISSLEKSFAKKTVTLQELGEEDILNRELKQFGYDFFKNSQNSGGSGENMPVGSDYVLGAGDVLKIDLWGGIQGHYELTVDRDGEITIPKVGVVRVWGLSYGQAKDVITKAVARYYKNFELNLSLGKLRTIQVFVIGAVEAPGAYSVNSLATVMNALAAAGGPAKSGSLRSVKIQRAGRLLEPVDCYDIFLSGDRNHDIRLENNDTVFVPVIGPVVAVAGEVKRPAIYEIKDKTTLLEVLQMAGGVASTGDTGRIQLERFVGNSRRVVLDIVPKEKGSLADLKDVYLQDRDLVKVYPVAAALRQVVQLRGNVVRPGEQQFSPGMRLRDLVPSYDRLLPDTYLDAVEITRLAAPDMHREVLSVSLRKALAGDEKENVELKEQDVVRVFSQWDVQEKPVVAVNGQVVSPGVYPFYPNMTVRDLLTASGSLKRNAYLENAELTRIQVESGQAKATHLFVNLASAIAGDPAHNLVLQPEDTLIVRGIVDWLEASDRFVTLKGEFRYPGVYSITKGERLSSVIKRAGGYSDKAYLPGVKFTRKAVQESQQKRMDEAIVRAEKEIMQKQGELASLSASREELEATKAALDGLLKGVERLKTLKAEGRVVMRLAAVEDLEKSYYDLELAGGDVLDMPQRPSVVNVLGEVYNSTSLVYLPGKPLSFYLKKAGGPMKNADEDEMYVIKADGSVFSRQQSSFGINWDDDSRSWTMGGFMSSTMEPGDTVVVPQKLERIAWMRNIKDITTIMSQIALTAGTILLGLK